MATTPATPKSTVTIRNTSETEAIKVLEQTPSELRDVRTIGPNQTDELTFEIGTHLTMTNFAQDVFIRTVTVPPKQILTSQGTFTRIGDKLWLLDNRIPYTLVSSDEHVLRLV